MARDVDAAVVAVVVVVVIVIVVVVVPARDVSLVGKADVHTFDVVSIFHQNNRNGIINGHERVRMDVAEFDLRRDHHGVVSGCWLVVSGCFLIPVEMAVLALRHYTSTKVPLVLVPQTTKPGEAKPGRTCTTGSEYKQDHVQQVQASHRNRKQKMTVTADEVR